MAYIRVQCVCNIIYVSLYIETCPKVTDVWTATTNNGMFKWEVALTYICIEIIYTVKFILICASYSGKIIQIKGGVPLDSYQHPHALPFFFLSLQAI